MWINLIIFLISSFMANRAGASPAKAALIGAGVTAAAEYTGTTEYLSDLVGISGETKVSPGDSTVVQAGSTPLVSSDIGSQLISETGDTLRSWGPLGTMGVVGAASAGDSIEKYFPWIIGGLAAFFLLKG